MTILDRARGKRRIRLDLGQLADDLTKHVPDLDRVDLGKVDLHKAREAAGKAVQDAADRARTLRTDIVHTAEKVQSDNPLDDLGQRLKAVASTGGLRAVVARLERELPDTDKDRYARAYARGHARGRATYLAVGFVAGVTVGVAGAYLLDPQQGPARRARIASRVRGLTSSAQRTAAGKARYAQDRARGIAIERGLVQPPEAERGDRVEPIEGVPVMATPAAAPAWPAEAGPVDRPLEDPAFGAHEALPEELVTASTVTDPVEPVSRD